MKITELIQAVRVVINEMATGNDSFTQEVDEALEQFIKTAMVQIASMPSYRGTPSVMSGTSSVSWQKRPDGLYIATFSCGEDFLRPVSVVLGDWVRPVYTFLPVTDKLFLAQYSSAPGIGNGPGSPVAFMVKDPSTRIIAHASRTAGSCELRYMKAPSSSENGEISMPEIYREALIYTASGLYQQSINEYDAAKSSFDTAASLLQTINNESQE